jgi:hypothetical protein
MPDGAMIDPNRLDYTDSTANYCVASEGRNEDGQYVPDIWHAVERLSDGIADRAACGAHYESDRLDTEVDFLTKLESEKCGGCLSRTGSPLAFLKE